MQSWGRRSSLLPLLAHGIMACNGTLQAPASREAQKMVGHANARMDTIDSGLMP